MLVSVANRIFLMSPGQGDVSCEPDLTRVFLPGALDKTTERQKKAGLGGYLAHYYASRQPRFWDLGKYGKLHFIKLSVTM